MSNQKLIKFDFCYWDGDFDAIVSIRETLYSEKVWSYSEVSFIVDNTSPLVSVVSPQNETYDVTDVPLGFTVNEQTSRLAYSLDGQENVTVSGDTVLSGLSIGEHKVVVYAWDEAGNVGASETVHFSVAEHFPTLPVAAAFIVAAAFAVGAGILIHHKKQNR